MQTKFLKDDSLTKECTVNPVALQAGFPTIEKIISEVVDLRLKIAEATPVKAIKAMSQVYESMVPRQNLWVKLRSQGTRSGEVTSA